jgi:hypothetical protein
MTARRRSTLTEETGSSLMELVVAMTVMLIFMGMFTGAIMAMSRSQSKAQSTSETSAQTNTVFLWFDKTVRYAAAISSPGTGTGTGDWYVEFRMTHTGTEVCTQARLDITTRQLQRRSWQVAGSIASGLTAWVPVTSGLANGSAAAGSSDQPFVTKPAKSSEGSQQLTINAVATGGPANAVTTSRASFSFTAINSTLPPATNVCQEVGRP